MSDLSDRERELVEAARKLCMDRREADPMNQLPGDFAPVETALRAYDPPKRKYTMPTWEEFTAFKNKQKAGDYMLVSKRMDAKGCVSVSAASQKSKATIEIDRDTYNVIFEALSTEEE